AFRAGEDRGRYQVRTPLHLFRDERGAGEGLSDGMGVAGVLRPLAEWRQWTVCRVRLHRLTAGLLIGGAGRFHCGHAATSGGARASPISLLLSLVCRATCAMCRKVR